MSKFQWTFEPPSLYQLSEAETCKNIWKHPKVRDLLKKKLGELPKKVQIDLYFGKDNLLGFRDAEGKILSQVNANIDKLALPSELKQKLKVLAEAMGIIMWEWLEKLNDVGKKLLGDLTSYVDHIKWTSDLYIDPAETLRAMYYSKVFPDSSETWTKLSFYCLEDCLEHFFDRVKSIDYDSFEGVPIQEWPCDAEIYKCIFPFYWAKFRQHRLDDFTEDLESVLIEANLYDDSETVDFNMFLVAIQCHNFPGAKYFWESLTQEQRLKMISVLSHGEHYFQILQQCTKSNGIDLAVFIWKQFSNYGDDKFFIDIVGNQDVMQKIVNWPWEDRFMKTLKKSLPYLDVYDLEFLLPNICRTIQWRLNQSNFVKYCDIFNEIWSAMSDNQKQVLDLRCCIDAFFEDIDFLNSLINDPALREKRGHHISHLITARGSGFMRLFNVDEFCTKVLESDEEKTWFRNNCIYVGSDYPPSDYYDIPYGSDDYYEDDF